jgi:hypothetical protein
MVVKLESSIGNRKRLLPPYIYRKIDVYTATGALIAGCGL